MGKERRPWVSQTTGSLSALILADLEASGANSSKHLPHPFGVLPERSRPPKARMWFAASWPSSDGRGGSRSVPASSLQAGSYCLRPFLLPMRMMEQRCFSRLLRKVSRAARAVGEGDVFVRVAERPEAISLPALLRPTGQLHLLAGRLPPGLDVGI